MNRAVSPDLYGSQKRSNGHCSGATGHSLKACLMSALARKAPFPRYKTMLTASSILAYLVEHSSLEIPSLTDWPRGEDKSRISLTEPSGLGAEPMSEQWVWGNGG